MKKKDNYKPITDNDYDKLFGLKKLKKYDIRKNAFQKAWEMRNFEIDKFWQRSAFFWGLIAIIFTGYITIVTGDSYETKKGMYIDYYLILLGIIFSVAWLLVIRGNKRWQDNWEKHIEYLEQEITGPLYRTLFSTGKNFYSVSKMNHITAFVVIIIWCLLLLQYFYTNCYFLKELFEIISNNFKVIFFIILPLLGTFFCIWFMIFKGHTSGGELKVDLKKDKHGAFFVRD